MAKNGTDKADGGGDEGVGGRRFGKVFAGRKSGEGVGKGASEGAFGEGLEDGLEEERRVWKGFAGEGGKGGEPVEEGLRWLAGHCRFVTTTLPRGELGVSFAAKLLAGLPEAVRRRVPDLSGTGPEVFSLAVDYGILEEMPSARVMRAVPRLIVERSPLFEARGKRHWTLWVVHALDPGLLAKIQRRTPVSQLEVCGPAPRRSEGRARREGREALATEVAQLRAALVSEAAKAAEARAREEALARALAEKGAALDRVLLDAAELAGEQGELRALRGVHAALEAEHRRLAAEVEPLRASVVSEEKERRRVEAALEEARAANQRLVERLAKLEGVDAAGRLVGDLWGMFKGK